MSTQEQERQKAADYYTDLLRPVFSGRKLVLVGGPVASFCPLAAQLRALGAERPFLLGTSVGTGTVPRPGGTPWRSLDISAGDVIEVLRRYEAALAKLPPDVQADLDAWDPTQQACALGILVLGQVDQVGGRPLYASRPQRWAALEDKVVIDAFWDCVGVERAPSRVTRVDGSALRAAAWSLDAGAGTVWSGDAREGINGGGVFVRWVKTEQDAREAESFFAAHCDRVRVMPFLDGVPCSIHAIVFDSGVCVFRPVEGITLRRRDRPGLFYAGMATFWDPPEADRDAIRALARRTGEALHTQLGYRGAFTIDGVLSHDGFRPTELNARIGAGLAQIAASVPNLPLLLLALAAREGERLAFQPEWLESVVLQAADAERHGGGWCGVPGPVLEPREIGLVEAGGQYRRAGPEESACATLSIGPGDVGGFVRFAPDAARVSTGPPLAPRVARALEFADQEFGLGIGPLEAAPEVR